jgi:cell division cycle protein 20 (cofactor of APC complex)
MTLTKTAGVRSSNSTIDLVALPSSSCTVTNRPQKIATQPERVPDAPGMVDGFYLDLLSWSAQNIVAIMLSGNAYIWKAETGAVVEISEAPEGTYVSSVDVSFRRRVPGIVVNSGEVSSGTSSLCRS